MGGNDDCQRRRMSPDIHQAVEDGRLAFVAGIPLSGNPYATAAAAPISARLRDLAWSHGWLRAQAAAERSRAGELVAEARAMRRSK